MIGKLGINILPRIVRRRKGRIERFWQTIQRRLPALFRLKGIQTIEEANAFLKDDFPKIYKKWFPVEPKSNETRFVKADMSEASPF